MNVQHNQIITILRETIESDIMFSKKEINYGIKMVT